MRRGPRTQSRSVGRGVEVSALLAASHAVLENHTFAKAARAVLTACKAILGTDGGLVAVYAANGKDLEVLYLDPGSRLEVDSEAGMPRPLRRLSVRAGRMMRTIFSNKLAEGAAAAGQAAKSGKSGRRTVPENALLAPVVVAGELVGLLGLFEKAGGFSIADCQFAEVFAEMTAVAMVRSRNLDSIDVKRTVLESKMRDTASRLTRVEGRLRTLVENLPDVIARFDPQLRHLYVSPSLQGMTGQPLTDYVGRTNEELGMPPALVASWERTLREVFATGQARQVELVVPAAGGNRHFECRILPEADANGVVRSVLSVGRDVTELRLAQESDRRAREIADTLREATIALTRSLDRRTVLTTLLDQLRRIVPFERATVLLIVGTHRVSIRAVFEGERVVNLAPDDRPELAANEQPLVEAVLRSGISRVIPDTHAQAGWKPTPAAEDDDRCWMGIPLFARSRVAGVISLSKREPCSFQDQHVQLAEALSSQASVAIENAILFEQTQTSTARMQSLSHRLVELQEAERRRIARELHDESGQALVSLRYGIRLLEREIAAGGDVTERVADLVRTTDAVIDSLHRLAADLRPASLDYLGLEAALRQHARAAGAQAGVPVRFKARGFGPGERVAPAVETAIYRVVQEALANVARHAKASRADVLLERRGDRVLVMVEDDGVGFEHDKIQPGDHLGLLGMKERAEALQGTLTVESSLGAGTTIVVEVACQSEY
jgi:PAS domain S-box-containing protein